MKLLKSKKGSWDQAVARYVKSVSDLGVKRTKEIMMDAHKFAVENSPQATGTFASNWRLSIGSPNPGRNTHDDSHLRAGKSWYPSYFGVSDEWKSQGDQEAVGKSLNSPGSKLSALRLGQRVYLSTSAINTETGDKYGWDIEDGKIKFRDENPSAKLWGGKISQKTAEYIRKKYKRAIK